VTNDDSLSERLRALSRNLWWTWNTEVISLFRDLDPASWRDVNHNPIALLRHMPPDVLEQRARETALDSRILFAFRRLAEYLGDQRTWAQMHAGPLLVKPVAYFVAEFGLHESLPLYSGGLGVLAGDTIKSASDLGVPFIGIGLFYAQSYFSQRLDASGQQIEEYGKVDANVLPLEPARGPDGKPLVVSVEMGNERIHAAVWHAQVGRARLVLLDSDVGENRPEDRTLTNRLYGGDRRTRLRQEIVLGIGGLRALRALGLAPSVIHLNEGHSAFATLERVRERIEGDGLTLQAAIRETGMHTVFTTHTPIEAGHDRFDPDLIEAELGWLRHKLGLSREAFLGLGRVHPNDTSERFCMTVLALRIARYANGVSSLHGHVSRQMWRALYPERPESEVPIGHITNGVHLPSWVAPAMDRLFQRHISRDWPQRACHADAWAGIHAADPTEMWEVHHHLRHILVDFVRRRLVQQAERRGEDAAAIERARRALSYDALTIGFARRFVSYKRATLLLHDIPRLARLLNDPERPMQIVFAGKAHPQDESGKSIIRQIYDLCREPRFEGKIVFVEDYDINVGRHLVQGADVWLNNPLRPLEACGTSGQKAAVNGVLNCSVLDGWWAEAYDGRNGFAIGNGDQHVHGDVQYARDAESLFQVLESQVVPLFYERDKDGIPNEWVARMKRSIRTLAWRFNADRMVMDYVRSCYIPAAGGVSCAMPPRS
jgi:starch phosphorylase